MARAVRLDKLRGLARLYADQRPGGANAFVPDVAGAADTAGVNDLINLALTELYDLLVAARGPEYYSTSASITLVAGTNAYSLPATFYQMQGLILRWNSQDHEPVDDMERELQRVDYINGSVWSPWGPKAYRIRAGNIEIYPAPSGTLPPCDILFVPAFQDLTADTQTFDGVNGWEKLVALRVAMELRAIEEMPFADLQQLYGLERERIEAMKTEREASQPKRVINVNPERRQVWPYARRPMP